MKNTERPEFTQEQATDILEQVIGMLEHRDAVHLNLINLCAAMNMAEFLLLWHKKGNVIPRDVMYAMALIAGNFFAVREYVVTKKKPEMKHMPFDGKGWLGDKTEEKLKFVCVEFAKHAKEKGWI